MILLHALVERTRNGRPYMAVIGSAVPIEGKPGLSVTLTELPEPEDGKWSFYLLSPKPIPVLLDDELPPFC